MYYPPGQTRLLLSPAAVHAKCHYSVKPLSGIIVEPLTRLPTYPPHPPLPSSRFLQSAFAGSQERAEGGLGSAAAREREEARARSFDDGMGGAGGAGDGRHFNHDNPDSDGDGRREPHFIGGGVGGLPPELAGLRELFTGIFGGAGGEGPQFFFPGMPGGGGGAGGRGGMQWGDYVFGQQGIDDIITQLMEQANGRSGAPPASDEAIAKLERFKLSDVERVCECAFPLRLHLSPLSDRSPI